ncbi:hypothetical protein V8C44DRAFT_142543 [Trichoderma aethiopicum]
MAAKQCGKLGQTDLARGPISRCTCHRCVDRGSQLDLAVDQPITSRANDGGQPVWSRNYGSRRVWRAYVARTCTPQQSTACKTEKMEHRGRVKEGPKGEAKTGDGGEVASAHVPDSASRFAHFSPPPLRLACPAVLSHSGMLLDVGFLVGNPPTLRLAIVAVIANLTGSGTQTSFSAG